MAKVVTLVKLSNILMAGFIDTEAAEKAGIIVLEKPRMVFADHTDSTLSLAANVGSPAVMEITRANADYAYASEDKQFNEFFVQETTDIPGLKIVK